MKELVLVHIFSLLCCVVLVNAQSYTGLQYVTSYQSHAVITSKNTKNTTPTIKLIEEYQDRVNQIGRIDEIAKGKRRQHFYYINDKQTATVEGSDNKSCKVRDITTFIKDEPFQAMASVQNNLLGPTALFFLPPATTLTSAGAATVRGISCSKWSYTIDSEYSVTLYLSVKDWNSTELSTEFEKPIRIEADVTDKVTSDIVHITIDFVLFIANQSFLDDTFVVPVGIGCKSLNRKYDNNAQTLKEKIFSSIMRYYIIGEIIRNNYSDDFGSFMENYKVVYDEKHNIIQLEGSGRASNLVYHSSILSYNTGVLFTMTNDGTCFMEPISENSATESLLSNQSGKRRTIQEIFKLYNDYSYLGRRFHRSILCDVYETIEENSSEKVVYTYFIAAPNYVSEMDRDSGKSTVVQFLTTSYSDQWQLEYDIFNVKHMDVETEMLNVDTCFAQSQTNYFAIYFPLDNSNAKDVIISKRIAFEKKARERIYDAAHISRLQLPFVRMYADSKRATLLGQMIDRPPLLAGFMEYPPLEEIASQESKNNQSAEECARDCLKATFEVCMSFDFCPDKCYFSPKEDSRAKNCRHFKRAVADSNLDEYFLNDALKSLQDAVLRKEISLTVTDIDGKDYTLKANSMEKNLKPFQFNTGSNKKYNLAFELHEMKLYWHTVVEVQEAIKSVEECYQKCHDYPYMYCSGFSFCGISNKCRITSSYLTSDNPKAKEQLSVASDCNVYMITAIESFKQFPGKIPKSRGEDTAYAETTEACAIQCRKASNFHCEGFEFCPDENLKCIMHSQHILDFNAATDVDATTPPTCSFWFLDYAASFADNGGDLVRDPLATNILLISFEECAKMCFTRPELNCRSINYCPEHELAMSECMINTKKLFDDNVNTYKSELCQHYEMLEERKELTTTTVTTQKTTTKTSSPSTDGDRSTVEKTTTITTSQNTDASSFSTGVVSTSTMKNIEDQTTSTSEVKPTALEYITERQGVEPSTFTGAVVGMLFFGLLVGALGFLGYSYYRSRKEDSGITVRFTKEQL